MLGFIGFWECDHSDSGSVFCRSFDTYEADEFFWKLSRGKKVQRRNNVYLGINLNFITMTKPVPFLKLLLLLLLLSNLKAQTLESVPVKIQANWEPQEHFSYEIEIRSVKNSYTFSEDSSAIWQYKTITVLSKSDGVYKLRLRTDSIIAGRPQIQESFYPYSFLEFTFETDLTGHFLRAVDYDKIRKQLFKQFRKKYSRKKSLELIENVEKWHPDWPEHYIMQDLGLMLMTYGLQLVPGKSEDILESPEPMFQNLLPVPAYYGFADSVYGHTKTVQEQIQLSFLPDSSVINLIREVVYIQPPFKISPTIGSNTSTTYVSQGRGVIITSANYDRQRGLFLSGSVETNFYGAGASFVILTTEQLERLRDLEVWSRRNYTLLNYEHPFK
ncbi:MAG: hypothetical protein KDD14_19790 [Saprospiraceae bacterium]|nr:hypothetical protein [Saprospiraceae bacterium]